MADHSQRKLEEYLFNGLKGVELSEIARQRGVSRQAIYQLLHKRLKKRFKEQYQSLKAKYGIENNLPLWVLRVERDMFAETGDIHVRSKRGVPNGEPERPPKFQNSGGQEDASRKLHAADPL